MSNASDKPEDVGAETPTGDAPTAPTPEPAETGPERVSTEDGADLPATEPAEEAAAQPAGGPAPSTEDVPAAPDAGGSAEEPGSSTEPAGGTDRTVDPTKPGADVPADPAPQGHQQPGYGQTAHVPPDYGQQSGYGQSSWYGPPGDGPPPDTTQQAFGGGASGPAPRPGIVPLRPLVAGDVLAGAVRYIRANPAATLVTSAAVVIVTVGLQMIVEYALPRIDPAALARGRVNGLVGSTLGMLGSTFVSLVLSAVLAGLLLVVLSQAVLGRRTGTGEAWRVVAPRAAGLVGLALLIALVIVVVLLIPILIALVAGATGSSEAIALGVFLILAAVAATVYLSVLWTLAPAAYVLEPVGVLAAMKRSARLVHRSWWRTFGILLLSGLLIAIPAIVVMGVFGALVERPEGIGEMVRAAIAYVLVGTFATPFGVGVTGLLYVDQRIRRERLDLELARYPAVPR